MRARKAVDYPIDVTGKGAVLLGAKVSCDGFHYGWPIRVQSHVHTDHMDAFDTSKGNQLILTSEETRELLISQYDADLPYRNNLVALGSGIPYEVDGTSITLAPTGHMLGSVQVLVETEGMRLGYSGDFQWPTERVFEVDALVLDSTAGSPRKTRKYSQGFAEERLLELVSERLKAGPIELLAFRGTLHRAMQVLAANIDCPLVGSDELECELEVYRQFGYAIDPLVASAPEDARCIRVFGRGDAVPVSPRGRPAPRPGRWPGQRPGPSGPGRRSASGRFGAGYSPCRRPPGSGPWPPRATGM